MPTLTTNYSFSLSVEGADDDIWGGFLNANWSALDTQLFSGTIGADTTGNAATATTASAATLAAEATVLETARTLTIAGDGKTFDGSANIAWTRADLGIELASQTEAETGTDNAKLMTPLRVKQSVTENAPAPAQLSEAQATDPNSTAFGTVSGERLEAVVLAHAGIAPAGAINSLVWAYSTGSNKSFGQTVSGSFLRPTSAARGFSAPNQTTGENFNSGSSLAGSWRCMGKFDKEVEGTGNQTGSYMFGATLWQRIA